MRGGGGGGGGVILPYDTPSNGSTDLYGTYCKGSCDLRGLALVTLGDSPLWTRSCDRDFRGQEQKARARARALNFRGAV